MLLLTEKCKSGSFFPKRKKLHVEFAERNKIICTIIKNNKPYEKGKNIIKVGYIVLHHSEISPLIIKDSSKDFFSFKIIISDILGNYGNLYSMTPKENRDYYSIGVKLSKKTKSIEESIKVLDFLENIFKTTYGK